MSNPFIFGVPVEGINFTNREKEKKIEKEKKGRGKM